MQTIAASQAFGGITTTRHERSKRAIWTGRVLSSFAVLFLTFDAVAKLLRLQPVIEGTTELGYSADVIVPLGITLLSCVILYLYPRTSLLGALLLTGYLGGAVATHVRVGNPVFTHMLAPTYFAAFLWGGLVLRDARLRILLPWYDRSRS